MTTPIKQKENGEFYLLKKPKGWDSEYADNLINYLNLISPLFNKAKEKSEFEFACTFIAFRGLQEPGWDPFENTIDIFEKIGSIKISDEVSKINLFLWVYGHIIEASEPYEIFANFLRIIDGQRYSIYNFPDKDRGKYKAPQFPADKIETLTELAEKVNMKDCLIPINDIFNKELRNGIFHSDYSLHQGGLRIHRNNRELSRAETHTLINKSLAYFQAIKFLYYKAISDYKSPVTIALPAEFNTPTGIVRVRKGYGLIGIRDNWSSEQLAQGRIPFSIGKYKWHELEILKHDHTVDLLPEDTTQKLWERYSKLYKWVPNFLRSSLNKLYKKKLNALQEKLIMSARH